jgi:hypothetical protein
MRKAFLPYFLFLYFFLSGGCGLLSAHSNDQFGLAPDNRDSNATFTIAQDDQTIAPSSKPDQEKKPRKLIDIEGAEEEWILGKKYLESSNCYVVVSNDFRTPDFHPGLSSGLRIDVNFSHFAAFSCLYLLYHLIRI